MKKIYCLLSVILFFATGCFNTTEDFAIQSDGSGVYAMKMDMSGMFDMLEAMQAMGGNDSSGNGDSPFGDMGKNMDTTINFASFTDTSSGLTAEEKVLMKNATMHMVMNAADKKFLMDLKFPFTRVADIERIMMLSQKNGGVMGKAFGNNDQQGMPVSPDFNSFFMFNFKDGLLEKKVDEAKYKLAKEDPQFKQIDESRAMMGEASMNTVIRLPRKVKKAEGPGVKVEPDGKTVNINASFADLFENPNALTFRVEY